MAEFVLPFKVHTARGVRERVRGLMREASMPADTGLWISPCKQVHTFGMKFPIDVAFVGHDGEILHMVHQMPRRRLSRLVWRAAGVLELPAGTLSGLGAKFADVIRWPDESDWAERNL